MDHARAEAFIPIPPSPIDFYAEIGDGLEFGWSSKGRNAPFANHEICKLDWYDGGSGENGHKIAESLIDFYSDWARVCFQFPSSLWWPGVLNKNGEGIDWASDEFREPFRLTAGR
jgi:hypothetical protein